MSLLKLLVAFEGELRIRRARPEDRTPLRRFIIENGYGPTNLPDKSSCNVRSAVDRGLLCLDEAGIVHVTDKGRDLIQAK